MFDLDRFGRASKPLLIAALLAPLLGPGPLLPAQPLSAAFTYQGRLAVSGLPANGNYDFTFQLFDTLTGGNQVGGDVVQSAVAVSGGLFTAMLDFGASAFNGQRRWLQVGAQPTGGGGYTTLSPRQEVTAAPNALWSTKAGDALTLGGVASSGYMLAGAIVAINQGGTGATDAVTARANLQAAGSGANTDITSLTGLATPIGVGQGGTGASTASDALTALNAQARVTGICSPGQYVRSVNADGTVVCGTDADTNSGGTVTSVATGAGLAGGPIATTGTLSIATGGVTSSMIANGAVGAAHIDASQVQARVAATCPGGHYLRGVNANGSVACELFNSAPIITTVGTANLDDGEGDFTSIAIGADGFPVISYRGAIPYPLKVAKCVNAACTGTSTIITTVDPVEGAGHYTSIAISADGFPVISYIENDSDTLKVAKCINAACTGTSTITTVDAASFFTSIAIGADGLPVISYRGAIPAPLKVAKCVNAACTGTGTITTVDPASVGSYNSIAIGADGFPVISYRGSPNTLKVAKCVDAACTGNSTITTVDPSINVGHYTSIVIGADGFPVISYWDASNFSLKVAKCVNAACTGTSTITTVDDPANSVGLETSIAIGTDGFPVISYFDDTDNTLKVAKCVNADCAGTADITTVDAPANAYQVGQYTSIAIGADGFPVISYFDNTANTLKVAKCNTMNCRP